MMRLNKIFVSFCFLLLISTACSSSEIPKDVDSMTPEELETAMQEEMNRNPPKQMTTEERAQEMKTTSSLNDGKVLKAGIFEGRAHPSSGDIKIIEKDDDTYLIFDENFKTDAGPELHVILTEHNDPKNSRNLR